MRKNLATIVLMVGVLLAIFFLTFHLHQISKEKVLFQFTENQLLIAHQVARQIESYFRLRFQDLRWFSSLASLQDPDREKMAVLDIQSHFDRLKRNHVSEIFFLDERGTVSYSTTAVATGANHSQADFFSWARDPANKGSVRVGYEKADGRRKPMTAGSPAFLSRSFSLVTPLYRESAAGGRQKPGGKFAGALMFTVDLEKMLAERSVLFTPLMKLHKLWIMDKDRTLLVHSGHPEMVMRNIRERDGTCNQCHTSFDHVVTMLGKAEGTTEYQMKGYPRKITAFTSLSFANASWIVAANAPLDEVTAFVQTHFKETLFILGIMTFVLCLAFYSVHRNYRRRVAGEMEVRRLHDQQKLMETLKESEERYRSLAASVDSMYLADRDCTYLFMNEGHRMRFGLPLEEIIGRRYGEFHSEEDTKEFANCIREVCETGKPIIKEHWSERDGRYFLRTFTPIMDRSHVEEIAEVVIVSKDITERKQAENNLIKTLQQLQETRDMLIQFEKEAVVGRLAVGVAHELLNPTSIISSRLQFMEEETLPDQARESVRICREQLQRITKISQDLHQSAAKQPGMFVGGDLRRVIEVGLQMMARRIKENHVHVEYDPPTEVIPVKMERDRLEKAMVNLILNACDAMTGNKVKRLIITIHRPEDSSKTSSLILTVADNGQGIPAGNLNRIFEPFFTTKVPGKGTGLGLSVSKGIIQEHGGTIHAENNDMGGASFIVELPLDHP